jgi:hypothetical protein
LTAIEAALTGPFEFHVRSDLHLKSETPGAWITMRFDEGSTPPSARHTLYPLPQVRRIE